MDSDLSLEEIEPGKNQTAVIGKVLDYSSNEGKILARLKVDSMKQGGANAPAFTPGSDINIVFSPSFQRSYSGRSDATVEGELTENRTILVRLNYNLKTGENQVNFLKVK